jgi:hypothetical protein
MISFAAGSPDQVGRKALAGIAALEDCFRPLILEASDHGRMSAARGIMP